VNVQIAPPDLDTRAVPRALLRDLIVVQPSVELDSVELICAALDGDCMIQRTRRNGADLSVHTRRVMKFFNAAKIEGRPATRGRSTTEPPRLAPLVFSWLADRGSSATRLDPHDSASAAELRRRLAALFADDRLFVERLDQR
jgi:hypothetical protein